MKRKVKKRKRIPTRKELAKMGFIYYEEGLFERPFGKKHAKQYEDQDPELDVGTDEPEELDFGHRG